MDGDFHMRYKNIKTLKDLFPFSLKDLLIMTFLETVTLVVGFILIYNNENIVFVTSLFVLSVVLISRLTHGYFYGAFSSVLSAVAINIFYYEFSMTQYNMLSLNNYFPFVCIISVSIITCNLTNQMREKEKIHAWAERERIRSDFLLSISHDLRTPLTSILGANSTVLENFDTLSKEQIISLLKNVNDESLWLIRMIENILSVTRIDSKDAKVSKKCEAVEEIVSEAVRIFKKRFPSQAVTVKVPQELLLVPMDAILIEQVLINLLENVIKHSGGSDIITVTVSREDDYAVFEVLDNGGGISADVFSRLFENKIRHKKDEIDNNIEKSFGIGLSVCMSIIKAHGGTMEAENRKNGGATFRFRLPFKGEEKYEQQADYTYS